MLQKEEATNIIIQFTMRIAMPENVCPGYEESVGNERIISHQYRSILVPCFLSQILGSPEEGVPVQSTVETDEIFLLQVVKLTFKDDAITTY